MIKRLFAVVLLLSGPLFAVNATPTNIGSVAVSGPTVTVNSTAHGLAVNQGFCMTGGSVATNAVCGVVATTPTANQFTFAQSGPTVCSSTCGTVAPALRVIVLNIGVPSQGQMTVNYLLWLTTQQPIPGPTESRWGAAASSAGASAAENNAISAGWFVEKQKTLTVPSNTNTATLQTILSNDWTMEQQAQSTNAQPGQWYGQALDSVGWAQQ